jgi:phage terminase small subunit
MAKTRTGATTAKPLNIRQLLFVSEYLTDLNGAAAYRRAYGTKKLDTCKVAARLLTNANVRVAIEASIAEKLARNALTADRVLEEYRRIAFADMRSFFDARGNLLPITDFTEEQGSQLAGLEVIIKNAEAGDGQTDTVHKFKLWDKTREPRLIQSRSSPRRTDDQWAVTARKAGSAKRTTISRGRIRIASARANPVPAAT